MARSRSCRSATSRSVSTPRGACPSTTPTMPRPRGVTATKMSTGLAVAQWIVQTSGTALTGLRMLTGNPSRKKITKQCPAATASAVRVASSTNSGSLPVRRTNRGPEASQKASPNRSDELTPHHRLMQVLDRLDEVRLPDHDIDIVRLVDGHHIPGKRRRGHTHMLPPARDSHVRCSECEQSSLRAPRSPLGFRVRPRTHRSARSPAHHPRACTTLPAHEVQRRDHCGVVGCTPSSIGASPSSRAASSWTRRLCSPSPSPGLLTLPPALRLTPRRKSTASLGSTYLLVEA